MTHRNVATMAVLAGLLLIASCSDGHRNQRDAGAGKIAATVPTEKDEVVALLKQALKDSDAWDKRVRSQSDRWPGGLFHSVKHWYEKYPVAYAKERLIARGSAIVPILLEITRDQKYAEMHFMAWMILANVNCPDFLMEVYQAGKEKRLSPGQVSGLILVYLPVRRSAAYLQEDKIMDWLGKQLADKSFGLIVLDLMDEYLKAEYEDGGMFPGVSDEIVVRWLNHVYDVDLDVWLATKAPSVLKFRLAQLAKGYDPATSFELGNNIANGLLDEAMAAIYSQREDQDACKELLEAVYPNELPSGAFSPLHPVPLPGWEQRLKDWYWTQRPFLRYDPSLFRFVPKTGQAVSRPTSMPVAQ